MKKTKLILFISFSVSSTLFSMEQKQLNGKNEENKEFINIIETKLPAELQLNIISFITSKLETIGEVIEYLKNISILDKYFKVLIDENINYIIKEMARNFRVSPAYAASLLNIKSSLDWLKNQTNVEERDIDKIAKYAYENGNTMIERQIITRALMKIYPFFCAWYDNRLQNVAKI